MQKPHDLRKLAEWYRGIAAVGHTDECAWRVGFAEYLEKLADEIEHVERRDERRKVVL